MSFELSETTKQIISRKVGIPYEQLLEMDDEEIEAHIEKKIGRKITWPKGAKVDRLRIRTMEEVDRRINKIVNEDDEWER